MKKLQVLVIALFILVATVSAQNIHVVRLPITDYMHNEGDSIYVVQVHLPVTSKIKIKEKTVGLLHIAYANSKNFSEDVKEAIGNGRCHLIKGEYYYFGIKITNKTLRPQAGDLLSFKIDSIPCYNGLLYELNKHHISLKNVEDSTLLEKETAFSYKSKTEENKMLEQLKKDISYTGTIMLQQEPKLNYEIKEGYLKGKKLLDIMINTTDNDVLNFVKYITAKPNNYAGGNWKISEIFATWVNAGNPTVIE